MPAKTLPDSVLAGIKDYREEISESGFLFSEFGWCHSEFFLEQFGEITCGFETAQQNDFPDCLLGIPQKNLCMNES